MTTAERTKKWVPDPENRSVLSIRPDEIESFDNEVKRFQAGEWEDNAFMAFRLKQGVYGQRQPDKQMIRVKLPFGGLNAVQMEALGRVAQEYTPLEKGHLTTRENMQFHHVPIGDTPEVLRILGDAGLTTREACGNTVRNVVGCPKAGVAKDEVFDVTPYAAAYARYFLRHETTQAMPRKVKSAFSGCADDCAITPIHDVGLVARMQDGVRGFKIVMGGGLSIMPKIAPTLYEFVPADDPYWLTICEAALRIFNRSEEERKNRMKARIKFLIDRIGMDEFRTQVEEELKGDWANKKIDLKTLMELEDEERDDPPSAPGSPDAYANGDGPAEFLEWKRANVEEQRQESYNLVFVALDRGDIFANQFGPLADIMREFSNSRARVDQQQNLVFRWVRTESLFDLYNRLDELDLAEYEQHTIKDIVTCPGTDSCKLGITSSMGLNVALRESLASIDTSDPLIKEIHIKASGCPNSCGQHHIANIGFHGAVMRGQGGQVPAYEVFLGGRYENGVRIGTRLKTRVPAKNAPEALVDILDLYKADRGEGERFNDFFDRVGKEPFEELLGQYKQKIGPLNRENIETYMDWERTVLYKVERGEGECAV